MHQKIDGKTKLSSSVTVSKYRDLVAQGNKKALAEFFLERLNERYFEPVYSSQKKSGFAMLAIACLLIETLESFNQGIEDTTRKSAKLFMDFLNRDTGLNALASKDNWFYKDIRCGILHQSETRGGWRIRRSGPLIDAEARTLNATAILDSLRAEAKRFADNIQTDEVAWANFQRKMNAVCKNCIPT